MNFISKYIAYIQDNPEGYWFKRKPFGWGWTPVKWQGWLTILVFLVILVWNFRRLDAVSHSNSDTLRPFLIQTIVLVGILLFICYKKGESPKWQWGFSDKNETKS